METPTTRAARIAAALHDGFKPHLLEVVDESHHHAGHAGARAGGQTHYAVLLVCDRFDSLSRIERHRLVNAALAEEFATGLHALVLTLRTSAEQQIVRNQGTRSAATTVD